MAFNQQSPQGVLHSFIQDDDPYGLPEFELTVHSVGRDNIAQDLADFFAMYPGVIITEICMSDWEFILEEDRGAIILLIVFVVDGERAETDEIFFMVRRGADWLIADGGMGDEPIGEAECLIYLSINTVGGVTASTNKLAVAAPYLVIVGLIAGLAAVVTVKMKRKD